ncbi:MAG: SDR family oxidoreductase [Actinobacteria bacterium]|nr:SDR family oxidoreductase [Actinomycetota bacterium]
MLTGKRLLVTGVVTTDSIAWAVAERAQLHGAEVILTTHDRVQDLTVAAACALPRRPEILTLDATRRQDYQRLRSDLNGRPLDGALHAIAFAPREALAGDFLAAGDEAIELAFRTSTTSYARLAELLAQTSVGRDSALVGLDFDADGRAWPVYNWMGVCKVALQSGHAVRQLRSLSVPEVAPGQSGLGRPVADRSASGIPDFERCWTPMPPSL